MEISYKSFYLRPDTPPEGIVRKPRDGAKPGDLMGGHAGEAAREAGLLMRRPPITPNTRLSFEASEFAKEQGLFEEFHRACYRAFWEEGANLGELPVLQGLGEQVGLEAQEMRARLEAGHYAAQVRAQHEEAISIGVQGIPSFIMGRYFFSGAQPYALFKEVAELVQREAMAG